MSHYETRPKERTGTVTADDTNTDENETEAPALSLDDGLRVIASPRYREIIRAIHHARVEDGAAEVTYDELCERLIEAGSVPDRGSEEDQFELAGAILHQRDLHKLEDYSVIECGVTVRAGENYDRARSLMNMALLWETADESLLQDGDGR